MNYFIDNSLEQFPPFPTGFYTFMDSKGIDEITFSESGTELDTWDRFKNKEENSAPQKNETCSLCKHKNYI